MPIAEVAYGELEHITILRDFLIETRSGTCSSFDRGNQSQTAPSQSPESRRKWRITILYVRVCFVTILEDG
jgi:hypothetical protein